MRLAPHTDGMNIRLFLGGRSPPRPSHRVGGWGNPVSPHPWGLCSRETIMRMAHNAAMHMTWERGRPARVATPRARCPRSQPIFTLAVHAAPPHNAAMKMSLFLGGRSPPKPSRGWGHGETRFPHAPAGRGRGETRFPHAPLREPMFTLDNRTYAVAFRRGGVAGRRSSTNRLLPARGGRAVGVAPGAWPPRRERVCGEAKPPRTPPPRRPCQMYRCGCHIRHEEKRLSPKVARPLPRARRRKSYTNLVTMRADRD